MLLARERARDGDERQDHGNDGEPHVASASSIALRSVSSRVSP